MRRLLDRLRRRPRPTIDLDRALGIMPELEHRLRFGPFRQALIAELASDPRGARMLADAIAPYLEVTLEDGRRRGDVYVVTAKVDPAQAGELLSRVRIRRPETP